MSLAACAAIPQPLNRPGDVPVAFTAPSDKTAPIWPQADWWQKQGEIAGPVMASEDAREGAVAFAEKRDPIWRGR